MEFNHLSRPKRRRLKRALKKGLIKKALAKAAMMIEAKNKVEPPFYNIVPQYDDVFRDYDLKYILLKGGRGSGKSFGADCFLIEESFNPDYENSLFIFAREIQTSIEDSVYALTKSLIEQAYLSEFFSFTNQKIKNLITGVEFSFIGLRATGGKTAFSQVNKIKGKFNVKYIFVDEAQDLTDETINVLFPTINRGSKVAIIKKPWHPKEEDESAAIANSRFIFAMNPNFESDPIVSKIRTFIDKSHNENKKPIAVELHVNLFDIPDHFQDPQLIEQAKAEEGEIYYDHVWLGKPHHKISGYPFTDMEQVRTNEEIYCWCFLDPSFKGGDYTALTFVGIMGNQIYTWGVVWHQAWNAVIDEICELFDLYKPDFATYEDNSLGSSPENLFAEVGYAVTGRTSLGNKHNRIYKVASYTAFRTKIIRNRCNDGWFNQFTGYHGEDSDYDDAADSYASAMIDGGIITDKMKF